ncbi:hypothetical protein QBC39DRAFT_112962 [Podospora conica]|nr:hypothetical protein QBC39DRAFT_112962 [Schizothecium conicum]
METVLDTPGPARMAVHVVSEPGRGVDNAANKPENVAVSAGAVVETGRYRASWRVCGCWCSALARCLFHCCVPLYQLVWRSARQPDFKLPSRSAFTPHPEHEALGLNDKSCAPPPSLPPRASSVPSPLFTSLFLRHRRRPTMGCRLLEEAGCSGQVPGSFCRATPAHDARGTFENIGCSCTPSGNNHQPAGASRHLHAQCPKVEAGGAVCCWSQDRPAPETGGRPPSVCLDCQDCLEHRMVLDDWWAPKALSPPDVREPTRSAVTRAIPHWPMLGGSSVRNMRVPVPGLGLPGWAHGVVSTLRPNRWSRGRAVPVVLCVCDACPSSHPSSWGSRRGAHRRASAAFRHTLMAR